MKHYFHFKKGQSVPQWLLRVLDSDTKESLDICSFMVNGKVMLDDETVEGLLAAYADVAAATDELVRTVDLAARQPLPAAPWFEEGASWSARRVFVHVVVETAQHAGHADIIRETIDGQKSMG